MFKLENKGQNGRNRRVSTEKLKIDQLRTQNIQFLGQDLKTRGQEESPGQLDFISSI